MKKTTKKRKPATKRRNPSFIDKLLGRQKTLYDESTVTLDEGVLKIRGKKHLKVAQSLEDALSLDINEVKVTFVPRGSNKEYIVNRRQDVVKAAKEEGEERNIRRPRGLYGI